MITGAHIVIYSKNPEADREYFRDALGLPFADAGDGWLIFALPPSELSLHPADENGRHELFLMCDDIDHFVAKIHAKNISCAPPQDRGWGRVTHLTLPGGGNLGVYQPRHARPK